MITEKRQTMRSRNLSQALSEKKRRRRQELERGGVALDERENTFWGPCAADPKVLDKDGRQPPGLWTC